MSEFRKANTSSLENIITAQAEKQQTGFQRNHYCNNFRKDYYGETSLQEMISLRDLNIWKVIQKSWTTLNVMHCILVYSAQTASSLTSQDISELQRPWPP